jgi:ABC-type multidrug transport system fused ATPase/permease subunit
LGNSIVLFSALLAVITGSKAGSAGLSLNNALGVTGLLNWAVRNGAETESMMNSVERVKYTIDRTPQEKECDYDSNVASEELVRTNWPWKGGLIFQEGVMRYREDFDPVLRGINLQVLPGERLGIVGRTGSGKRFIF